MKKYGVIFLGIISLFAFYKCSNEKENLIDNQKQEEIQENVNGQDKAWRLIKKFVEQVNSKSSRSNIFDFSDLKIKKIDKDIIKVDNLCQNLTRSSKQIDINVDTYRFTFEKDSKQGFAIATDDQRVDRVLAFVEEGALADTAYVPGMAYMVKGFKDVLAEDLNIFYTKGTSVV